MKSVVKVVAGGNDRLARDIVSWLADKTHDLVAIYSERRGNSWEFDFDTWAKKQASEMGIPFLRGNINYLADELRALGADLLVPVRCKNVIWPAVLNLQPKGCVHIHYGALPRYGGDAPISWAILNDETEVSPTLQYMAPKVDSGDIIDQRAIDITQGSHRLLLPDGREIEVRGMTAHEIYNRCNDLALAMFVENYPALRDGKNERKPQDLETAEYRPVGSLNFGRDKFIDLSESTNEEIARHVRAFDFPPMQRALTAGEIPPRELRLYPTLENNAREIAEHLGVDQESVLGQFEKAGEDFSGFVKWIHHTEAEWDKLNINQNDPESVAAFYRETDNYIYELMESWATIDKNLMVEKVLRILKNQGCLTVLSFGAGAGQDIIQYCFNGFQTTAADLPGKTFDFAQWRFLRANVFPRILEIHGDSPLDENYDAITCFEVLQHVVDPVATIRHLREHLNPAGLLFLTFRFQENYRLALKHNEIHETGFPETVCEQGFTLVHSVRLWGPKENPKILRVFLAN
jgi:methionyl-tRNA formyltransferase